MHSVYFWINVTNSPDRDTIISTEKLTINDYDEIGEGGSINSQLPQEAEVIFTDSKIEIPELDIEIPYSTIRDFRIFKEWTGSEHKKGILWYKYKATWTRYWRLILEDRTYFTLSKSNSNIGKATRAGAVEVSVPNLSERVAEEMATTVQNDESQLVTYVPVDYLKTDGELRVEGWKDGASEINAGVDADATTAGVSLGFSPGPVSVGGSASKSSISGDIDGEISDNTYSTPIDSFLIFEDKIIIDSDLHIELYYDEIDRVTPAERGFVIYVGETTYRTKIQECRDEIGDIAEYMNGQITSLGADQEEVNVPKEIANKLTQLKELHTDGVISDDDFEKKKSELLDDF